MKMGLLISFGAAIAVTLFLLFAGPAIVSVASTNPNIYAGTVEKMHSTTWTYLSFSIGVATLITCLSVFTLYHKEG